MGQEFSYRLAPLGRAVKISVGPNRITARGLWSVDLSDLDQAAFVRARLGGNQMIRLDLYTGNGRHSVSYNGSLAGMEANEDARQHRAAMIATLHALSRVRPEMRVALGAVQGARWGMFAVGAGAVLLGAGLLVAAVATGVSGDRLVAAATPVVLLLTLGVFLIASYGPWRDRPQIDPVDLANTLAETATGSPTPRSAPDERSQ